MKNNTIIKIIFGILFFNFLFISIIADNKNLIEEFIDKNLSKSEKFEIMFNLKNTSIIKNENKYLLVLNCNNSEISIKTRIELKNYKLKSAIMSSDEEYIYLIYDSGENFKILESWNILSDPVKTDEIVYQEGVFDSLESSLDIKKNYFKKYILAEKYIINRGKFIKTKRNIMYKDNIFIFPKTLGELVEYYIEALAVGALDDVAKMSVSDCEIDQEFVKKLIDISKTESFYKCYNFKIEFSDNYRVLYDIEICQKNEKKKEIYYLLMVKGKEKWIASSLTKKKPFIMRNLRQ